MIFSWERTFDDIFLRANWRETILLRALWRATTLILIFYWGHNEERQFVWWYFLQSLIIWDYSLRIFTWAHSEVKQYFWWIFSERNVSILLMLFSSGHREIENFFDYSFLSSQLRAILFSVNFYDFSNYPDNIWSKFCGGGHSVERALFRFYLLEVPSKGDKFFWRYFLVGTVKREFVLWYFLEGDVK